MAPAKRSLQSIIDTHDQHPPETNKGPAKRTRAARIIQDTNSDDENLSPPPDSPANYHDTARVDPDVDRSPPDEEDHSGEVNASAQDEHHLNQDSTSDQDPNPLSSNSNEKEHVPEGTTSDDVPPSSPPWNSLSDSHGSDRSKSPSSPPPSTAPVGPVTNPITTYVIPGHFGPKLQSRVTALLQYKNEKDHVYSISCLPIADLSWGGSENASANKLCIRGHDMPVTVWITALIGRHYMFEPDGSPKKKVSVALAPLTEHSLHTNFKVLHDFSKPQEPIDTAHRRIYASRWQQKQLPRQREMAIQPFKECYDATRRYTLKTQMPRVDVEDLKEGDLVLVEAEISRFSTADVNPNKSWAEKSRAKKKGFVEYKAMFELSSISLLKAGPEATALSSDPVSREFAVSI